MVREYTVTVQSTPSRPIAAVQIRLPIADVPRRFADYLHQVYSAARGGALDLDGQNVFVYSGDGDGQTDIEFGVGVRSTFERAGSVSLSATPSGTTATTTHWGDYAGLGAAHAAVLRWCRDQGRSLAGPRWEVYGHWSDDPSARRTDVFYLLSDDHVF